MADSESSSETSTTPLIQAEARLLFLEDKITIDHLSQWAATRRRVRSTTLGWWGLSNPKSSIITMPPDDVKKINDEGAGLLVACSQLQYLRFSFRLEELKELSDKYLQKREWSKVPLLLAMRGFAKANLDPSGKGGTEGVDLLNEAVKSAPNDLEVVLVAMLGLRADAFKHARRIIEISDEFARNPFETCRLGNMSGPTLFFHRSQAFRTVASMEPDQEKALRLVGLAEQSIYYALQYLMRSQNTLDVLQDFVREREVVLETRARIQQRAAEELRRIKAIEEQVEVAKQRIDGSLIRVVEILAVFVALIGFALASFGGVFSELPSNLTWSEVAKRAFITVAAATGMLLFFLMLRLIVHGRSRTSK
jgi:hypothetical protein